MAEFPLPVLQIWRSRKRVAIQIQLMNIHVSEWKYYCLRLVPKFGDMCDRQNWRLHPTANTNASRKVPLGLRDRQIPSVLKSWPVAALLSVVLQLELCCTLSAPTQTDFWAARGIEIVWGQWLVPPVRRIRRCIGYFLVILLIDVKILLHHAQREARPQDICSCEDALVFTPVWQAISRDVACV